MHIGVSTACLYPMESEKALVLLQRMGFCHFEFFANSYQELQLSYLKEFKNILGNGHIKSMHPFTSAIEAMLFFGDYPRRFQDGLDFYKRYFEAAAYLGADVFVLHGQLRGRDGKFPLTDEEYCVNYHRLYEAGMEFGVRVCQENVFGHRSGSIQMLRYMKENLGDRLGFVFDIKQCHLCGESPQEMIEVMGNRLCHVHLSDYSPQSSCLLPGQGQQDFAVIQEALSRIQYEESVIIEVYSSSYGRPEEIEAAGNFTKAAFFL